MQKESEKSNLELAPNLQTLKTIKSESNQFWIVWIVGFFGFLWLSAPKVEICDFGGSDAVMRAHAVQYGELPLPKGTGPMGRYRADRGPMDSTNTVTARRDSYGNYQYRTRQWRKFQHRKSTGEVSCCDAWMAERTH